MEEASASASTSSARKFIANGKENAEGVVGGVREGVGEGG